jgi:cysteine synthase
LDLADEIIAVKDEEAIETARKLARTETEEIWVEQLL